MSSWKKYFLLLFLHLLSFHLCFPKSQVSIFFKKSDKFFKKYVKDGRVKYDVIRSQGNELNEIVVLMGKLDLKNESENTRKSFYINAYNLLLIKSVVEYSGLVSSLESPGLFSKSRHWVAGDSLTLNEIEEQKLLKAYRDARILFTLSSGTIGSVKISRYAYKPNKLEKQLTKKVKEVANDFSYVRVMNKSSKILLDESFRKSMGGYMTDFILWLNKYRETPLPDAYAIDFYPSSRRVNITEGH
jgi:hypothetical protein